MNLGSVEGAQIRLGKYSTIAAAKLSACVLVIYYNLLYGKTIQNRRCCLRKRSFLEAHLYTKMYILKGAV